MAVAERDVHNVRHGPFVYPRPDFNLPSSRFYPNPIPVRDPRPFRRFRIDLDPSFPPLIEMGTVDRLEPGLVGVPAARQGHGLIDMEVKGIFLLIACWLRFFPVREEPR